MRLYNTLTRSLEPFSPLAPPTVTMYVCGPTVYDDPHIGHVRSAYIFDVLRRYLTHQGFAVRFIRNVTDVDDKIIEKARQETGDRRQETGELSEKCREIAERYLKSYHEAMDRLGIERPNIEPLATEHVVPEMTDCIAKLLLQGAAYEAKGDVYFSVRKFPDYGKLSNRTLDELQAGSRVEPGEHKQDPLDFALWKAAKPDEPSWESPWGKGRPGWHIECSTMSTKYLGDAFDIHGGGLDLVFPHHENEIAQAQAAGKPFATYWVHNGLLTVNGEKMSKSLGNFITVEQALEKCQGEPDIVKTFFLGAHYRSPIDYTVENLASATQRFKRLLHFLHFASFLEVAAEVPRTLPRDVSEFKQEFERAMDEDLNTPEALAVLDKLVSRGHGYTTELATKLSGKGQPPYTLQGTVILVARTLRQLGEVLGLFLHFQPLVLTREEKELLDQREAARKRKDFEMSDRIRKAFAQKGYQIEDTPDGPVVLPKR